MYKYHDNTNSNNSLAGAKDKDLLQQIINQQLKNTSPASAFYKVLQPYLPSKWVEPYMETAKKIRDNFHDLIVISMGGATLNPQIPLNLVPHKSGMPGIHFLNNLDPYFFHNLRSRLNLKDTAVLVISSSGKTLETITLFGVMLQEYKSLDIKNYKDNFYFIIGKNPGLLRSAAEEIGSAIFEHEDEISGRYAGFTNVTTLIGLIAGLDMDKFLKGANNIIDEFWQMEAESIPAKAAINIMTNNKPVLVNIGYLQSFSPFLEWYNQIIAESLGKDGKGFTPIKGLGPNDQHSMLQLYLDGPKDKLVTLFYIRDFTSPVKDYVTANHDNLQYLANKPLHEINSTCFHATLEALQMQEVPTRIMTLDDLSESSIGALMAHSMIEVILLARLLAVNPFDQPGVELIKNNTLKKLQ